MKRTFPDHFLWGAAASGPQLEGGREGRGKTVWDYWFEVEPDKFYQRLGPAEVSNFYRHYKADIAAMKELGFNSFRTSISWSRLLPDGEHVNRDAVLFYRDVLERLRENGIKPIMNLYHFDMPYRLYRKGGWENREVVEEFVQYAQTAFECFGDIVEQWVTFNEPIVPIEMGYLHDQHLPAVYDLQRAFQAGFHTVLAHALTVRAFRQSKPSGEIGIILNLSPTYPRSDLPEDQEAAAWADLFYNRSFLDPVVQGQFPAKLMQFMQDEQIKVSCLQEDLQEIKEHTVDFLGVNYYQPRRVQAGEPASSSAKVLDHYFQPYHWPKAKMNPHRGWEIYEKGLYDLALDLRDHYGNIPWYVAENGMGVEGEERFISPQGEVQDDYRIEFMEDHLTWLHQAIEEGSNCFGYHVWTFLDNWSWLNEYKNRYGLLRLELDTGTRHRKKSARWFRELATSNQLPKEW